MLKDNTQMALDLSPYQGLYDAIIPKNHILRKLKDNIDFSFVNPMLRKQYCEHFGRPAKEPEMMFKLLFLKKLYDMIDFLLPNYINEGKNQLVIAVGCTGRYSVFKAERKNCNIHVFISGIL